ncbi:sigma-70 family RNA polymerase sigma factor [Scytonema millei]|uniref:Sigma-70 family RNA polymerase sigma factor n=1 Tax=Scytonema millei VB511283 TaxID=1245923 RepID=A0A9X5E5V8_9CYAN|nr:sigma-70 family RNA polymerase sigma factor [Scytonema millei]NHC35930.1 sigma-70 family RNA polymerase sigma factor [Scytonema millei VB511283]
MRPRQGIIEIFSTFLQFDADRFRAWVSDPHLRRSMQARLAQSPQMEAAENYWVLYWYKLWQTQPESLAKAHLTAYLQEVCYWTAHKTSASFTSSQYTLSDCFQMAIARFDKVLKGFNPQLGYGFKSYASAIFSSVLKDLLRQQQEVDISTNWSLLRRLSQKRLVESLQNTGLGVEVINRYVLAWNCFKTLYVPTHPTGTRQLPKPESETWEAIAKLYNQERITQLHPSGAECNAQTLEKWLVACAKAARSYLYPSLVSIDAPKPGQESGAFLDDLGSFEQDNYLNEMIAVEEQKTQQSRQTQMQAALAEAIAKLDSQAQTIMQMYYGQGLTQQEIAKAIDTKQYTVSRRLTRARESMLLALAKWSQETLHITLTSEVLNNINTVLEEWLQVHYRRPSSLMESTS